MAIDKLKKYYSAPDTAGLINVNTDATILAPQYKLEFFRTPEWQDQDFASKYKAALEQKAAVYKNRIYDASSQAQGSISSTPIQEIELLLNSGSTRPAESYSEPSQYLQGG
ncbi:uncharacterized protein N7511_011301 [Penicillium nucicola]|uniref:uncharacterized protein n=1 Tax=Penicillium nucicola TaxID=1850975 RepID=UPI002545A3A5|nr:uncharacterized protein N7511_011301 [Penicillium nucicola]KAJ5742569.1 hypothetical protein N7511_011301 [Penicillium nucicola]